MKWWLSSGDKPEGPFPAEHVTEWLKSGQISPDTMACPEGGQEWKRLDEIDEFARFVPPPPPRSEGPPPPPPGAPPQAAPAAISRSAGGVRAKFGVLTAAIVLSACCLALELLLIADTGEEFTALHGLGLCVAIAAIVIWAIYHYHLWALLPAQFAETTPGKAVGYMFIPFYNCYWVFRSYLGVNRGLNQLADAHGLPQPRTNAGLATAAAVLFVVGWFFLLLSLTLPDFADLESQYFYDEYDRAAAYEDVAATNAAYSAMTFFLSSAPNFIVWLLMVFNQKQVVAHLVSHGAPVNTDSGLIET